VRLLPLGAAVAESYAGSIRRQPGRLSYIIPSAEYQRFKHILFLLPAARMGLRYVLAIVETGEKSLTADMRDAMGGAGLFAERGLAKTVGTVVQRGVAVPLRIAGGHRGSGPVHILFDNCYYYG
jgi:hypothetical protein